MSFALLIRLRPLGPWRYGPGEGGRDRVDSLYRSDRLFSAVTLAFERLGLLDEWLSATARTDSQPAVSFSSLFPYHGDTLFVPPPATLWPPPSAAVRISSPVFLAKIRWRAARFVPVQLVETLLSGERLLADQWMADAESGCLLRRDRPQPPPFRLITRTQSAVDRLGNGAESHALTGVEFEPGAGLWAVADFASEKAAELWKGPLQAAFKLLADSGFGGRRSSGWGQTAAPEFEEGAWPDLLLPKLARARRKATDNGNQEQEDTPHYWLLSLFSPASSEAIAWSGGSYSLTTRGGRIESTAGYGHEKKLVRMIEEGSVLATAEAPRGMAVDVAPEGFPHPVYRSGFALSLQLPIVEFTALPEETPKTDSVLDQALAEALQVAAEEEPMLDTQAIAESIAEEPSKLDPGEIEKFAAGQRAPENAAVEITSWEPEVDLTAEPEAIERSLEPPPDLSEEKRPETTEGESEHEV
jgi:CRISPR type III-A-associated RAMP protein Csm4